MTRVDTAREAGLYFRGGPQKKQLDGNTGLDGVRSSSANKLYLGGTNTSRRRHKNVKSVLFFRVNRTFRVCVLLFTWTQPTPSPSCAPCQGSTKQKLEKRNEVKLR